jgi:GxxExxY protein
MLIDAPFNPTTKRIIDAAVEVHRHIGPGLLESTYLECLESEFADRGIRFERERVVPIIYKQKRQTNYASIARMAERVWIPVPNRLESAP